MFKYQGNAEVVRGFDFQKWKLSFVRVLDLVRRNHIRFVSYCPRDWGISLFGIPFSDPDLIMIEHGFFDGD